VGARKRRHRARSSQPVALDARAPQAGIGGGGVGVGVGGEGDGGIGGQDGVAPLRKSRSAELAETLQLDAVVSSSSGGGGHGIQSRKYRHSTRKERDKLRRQARKEKESLRNAESPGRRIAAVESGGGGGGEPPRSSKLVND
jgi:hypothetical protein